MPAGEMESKSAADGRYRTLLEVSGSIASQPNLKAVLQKLDLKFFGGPSECSPAESKRRQSWSFLTHGFFRIDEKRPYQCAGEKNPRRDEEWSAPHPPLN